MSLEFAPDSDLQNAGIQVKSVKKRYIRDSFSPLGELDRWVIELENTRTREVKVVKLNAFELPNDAGHNQIRDAVLKKITMFRKEKELVTEYQEVALTITGADINRLATAELRDDASLPPLNPFEDNSRINGEARGVFDRSDRLIDRFVTHTSNIF